MKFRQTKWQTARGARADAEAHDKLFLFKNVSELRATYQIRLLLFRATQEGKKLLIDLPKTSRISPDLMTLARANSEHIQIERV